MELNTDAEPFNNNPEDEPRVAGGSPSKKTLLVLILGALLIIAIITVIIVVALPSSSTPEGSSISVKDYAYIVPKAELHIHIEGTFEAELAFKIAERNGIELPYKTVEELKEKYKFANLQEFLDLYYQLCDVLIKEEDFSDLAYAYATKAYSQGLKYAEIFFDPQSHLSRNITFETLINGLTNGLDKAKEEFKGDFDYRLIMCFLRHLSEDEAFETYEQSKPYMDKFFGIGLDSSEKGFPPSLFKDIYEEARKDGLHVVAHAGEEGPADYIKEALDELKVERIDHGVRIVDDPDLVKRVAAEKIPLTMCPLSNQKLQVCPDLKDYKIREMYKDGLQVMVNSDDPAYFGGYIGDNYYALVENLNYTKEELRDLAVNSFNSTFLEKTKKDEYIKKVRQFHEDNK